MYYTKKIVLLQFFLFFFSWRALPTNSTYSSDLKPENTDGILIYRSLKGNDYLFSADSLEGPRAGYFPQEARFGLFTRNTPGTTELYRCIVNSTKKKTHFLSTDFNCEGQMKDGIIGNIAASEGNNLVPLSRFVNLLTQAHVYAIPGDIENFNGWKFEGIQGFVIPIKIPTVTITPDDGKKYFGFYAGAMDGVGDQDYIPELANNSNLIFIKSQNFESKLIECEKLNLKAIITFDWIFFDEKYRLKNNFSEVFIQQIEPILKKHLNTIVAFYGLDEPYANGKIKGISDAETYNAQETMGRFLKSRFPNIPIGVIFSKGEVVNKSPIFPSFDWFGFDCYVKKLKCNSLYVQWLFNRLNSTVQELTVKDSKKRYLISVPQAGHSNKVNNKTGVKNIRIQVSTYRAIIRSNPNVKIVMPFIWQSFDDGTSNWTGAREMPEVVKLYNNFYIDFMSGNL